MEITTGGLNTLSELFALKCNLILLKYKNMLDENNKKQGRGDSFKGSTFKNDHYVSTLAGLLDRVSLLLVE